MHLTRLCSCIRKMTTRREGAVNSVVCGVHDYATKYLTFEEKMTIIVYRRHTHLSFPSLPSPPPIPSSSRPGSPARPLRLFLKILKATLGNLEYVKLVGSRPKPLRKYNIFVAAEIMSHLRSIIPFLTPRKVLRKKKEAAVLFCFISYSCLTCGPVLQLFLCIMVNSSTSVKIIKGVIAGYSNIK